MKRQAPQGPGQQHPSERHQPAVRGAFSPGEDASLLSTGVPLFPNKEEAQQWCHQLLNCPGSLRPELKHSVTTFVGWNEVS
jgi:hypothetical protein